MKKFRYKNWMVLLAIVLAYTVMGYHNGFFGGFWQGFLLIVSLLIFIGELYWIFTGKEMKGYILKDRESQDKFLG